MKITIQSGEFTYSYDDSCNNKIIDGFVEENHADAQTAVEAALELLACCYDREEIAKCIQEQNLSILENIQ